MEAMVFDESGRALHTRPRPRVHDEIDVSLCHSVQLDAGVRVSASLGGMCGQAGVTLYTRLRALRCTGALHDVLHRRFTRGYLLSAFGYKTRNHHARSKCMIVGGCRRRLYRQRR